MSPRFCLGLSLLLGMGLAAPAQAVTLVVAASTPRVEINSNFDGAAVTIFGTLDPAEEPAFAPETLRLVIAVEGPAGTIMARRKDRLFGLWINHAEQRFTEVPGYIRVLTSAGGLADLAAPEVLHRLRLGTQSLVPEAATPDAAAFKAALIRQMTRAGLYAEAAGQIEFLNPRLFRATIDLPADVPVGGFRVRAILFRDRSAIAEAATEFSVAKSGFEQDVFAFSRVHPWRYGLITVLLALLTGWIAATLFRRK